MIRAHSDFCQDDCSTPGPAAAATGGAPADDSKRDGALNGSRPQWCARLAEARRERVIVDRADFDPRYDPSAPIECDRCGCQMRYIAACKILCPNCGYRRDCSDP